MQRDQGVPGSQSSPADEKIARVMAALDVDSADKAAEIAKQLAGTGCWLKIGLELYALSGLSLVQKFKEMGFSIFLDLKLHDIPNTVARTMQVLVDSAVDMINVHCAGGYEMMARAAEIGRKSGKKIIGVTVLTSMGQEELSGVGVNRMVEDQVINLALLAQKAGLDGVVASAREVVSLRRECGADFLLVTPGIRPAGSEQNDQVRVLTPKEALENGSSYLVVGRPITAAVNPREALFKLFD
ncbi:orotidine-5'-phosphate decarboxylase [Syntrophobotulus glycolicus DSM 8271]|uniref:Orotidine 5'-phosphate decarboxylase n=1 Tax=Syntrophobotulus glycolicus (strain DSM 8271 / FlGlyR) TaxID=645991 RepID=F0T0H8_SYNGF|nr:orotidine-5'-phosphate decarboxylase [Syntrophobotulus glycolicus]ADY55043.1 orotidine-5'-phosphate decarboxylase [Syntrophobotulus glycolicus DSM 8271]